MQGTISKYCLWTNSGIWRGQTFVLAQMLSLSILSSNSGWWVDELLHANFKMPTQKVNQLAQKSDAHKSVLRRYLGTPWSVNPGAKDIKHFLLLIACVPSSSWRHAVSSSSPAHNHSFFQQLYNHSNLSSVFSNVSFCYISVWGAFIESETHPKNRFKTILQFKAKIRKCDIIFNIVKIILSFECRNKMRNLSFFGSHINVPPFICLNGRMKGKPPLDKSHWDLPWKASFITVILQTFFETFLIYRSSPLTQTPFESWLLINVLRNIIRPSCMQPRTQLTKSWWIWNGFSCKLDQNREKLHNFQVEGEWVKRNVLYA